MATEMKFDGIKVFSTTLVKERLQMGEVITAWIAQNKNIRIVDTVVTQSSDEAFHCLTVTLFYASKQT